MCTGVSTAGENCASSRGLWVLDTGLDRSVTLGIVIAGATAGLGLLVLRLGIKGRALRTVPRSTINSGTSRSLCAAFGVGVTVFLLSGWVPVSCAAAVATFVVARSSARTGGARDNEEVAEAVALWTEQLRDTLAAAFAAADRPAPPVESGRLTCRDDTGRELDLGGYARGQAGGPPRSPS